MTQGKEVRLLVKLQFRSAIASALPLYLALVAVLDLSLPLKYYHLPNTTYEQTHQ